MTPTPPEAKTSSMLRGAAKRKMDGGALKRPLRLQAGATAPGPKRGKTARPETTSGANCVAAKRRRRNWPRLTRGRGRTQTPRERPKAGDGKANLPRGQEARERPGPENDPTSGALLPTAERSQREACGVKPLCGTAWAERERDADRSRSASAEARVKRRPNHSPGGAQGVRGARALSEDHESRRARGRASGVAHDRRRLNTQTLAENLARRGVPILEENVDERRPTAGREADASLRHHDREDAHEATAWV